MKPAEVKFRDEINLEEAIQINGARITPFTRSTRWNIFGRSGGIAWERPAAVLVQYAAGEEEILPIRDVTREMQIKMLALGVVGSLIVWLAHRK